MLVFLPVGVTLAATYAVFARFTRCADPFGVFTGWLPSRGLAAARDSAVVRWCVGELPILVSAAFAVLQSPNPVRNVCAVAWPGIRASCKVGVRYAAEFSGKARSLGLP